MLPALFNASNENVKEPNHSAPYAEGLLPLSPTKELPPPAPPTPMRQTAPAGNGDETSIFRDSRVPDGILNSDVGLG